jgi:hypothetical protein
MADPDTVLAGSAGNVYHITTFPSAISGVTYSWSITGNGIIVGPTDGTTVSVTATTPGVFVVTCAVTEDQCVIQFGRTVQVIPSISDVFAASAFAVRGNKTTRLAAGKPFTCVQIEPVGGSFDVTAVDLSSIKMISVDTGSVSEIFATAKTTIDGDTNGNGVTEIAACFSKDDLRLLYSALPSGHQSVIVSVQGSLVTGGRFEARLTMDVVVSGRPLAALAAPNPFNPETVIGFATKRPGPVRLQIFDLTGRLVAALADASMPAGYHSVRWDGRSVSGGKVASGIYYFRLEADGEAVVQRLTVLK